MSPLPQYLRGNPKNRSSAQLDGVLDAYIRAAVRRGIVINTGGELKLYSRTIADHDRNELKTQFLAALSAQGTVYVERQDAIRAFARWMGFSRAGNVIEDTALSLINGLLRENRLSARGREIRRL